MFAVGMGRAGRVWADLAELPHLLIGGMTGRGKSVFLRPPLDQIRLRPGAAAPATARPLWGATACAAASRVSFTGFVPRARGARRHEGGERVLGVSAGQRRVEDVEVALVGRGPT